MIETEGSKAGKFYEGPGGEKIAKLGKQTVGLVLKDGQRSKVTFISAKVVRPLLAVSSVVDKGNGTIFLPGCAFILPLSKEMLQKIVSLVMSIPGKIELTRERGVYHLPAWLMPAVETGFPRQGA